MPQQITAISAAYTTYMTCYSGAWADIAATSAYPAATMATSYPDFTATSSMACRDNSVPIVITRTVVVQGKTISFERAVDIPFN